MTKQFVVITSGPIAAGKSSVVGCLVEQFGYRKLSSGNFLRDRASQYGRPQTRLELVKIGDELDHDTDFEWVATDVAVPALETDPAHLKWIFDSVRKHKQVSHFRTHFPDAVFHVHFVASEDSLRGRFLGRQSQTDIKLSYEQAIDTPNEREARSLIDVADVVIDTTEGTLERNVQQLTDGVARWLQSS